MSESRSINGFDVYKEYLALRNHFTKEEYNYFKYNGKVNVKESTFKHRKDRWHFEKIAKKYQHESYIFLLSNLIADKGFWPRNSLTPKCDKVFREWMGYVESGCEKFKDDLLVLKQYCDEYDSDFDDLFVSVDNMHPIIYKMYVKGHIRYNTFCILESFIGFAKKIDVALPYDPMWEEESFRLKKSSIFCRKTKEHVDIVMEVFN